MEPQILITGDYWHREFKQFLAAFQSVTLIPLNKIATAAETAFDLIIIAQSQPDQISLESVELLQSRFPNVPIVAVLGSWCEGGLRTGQPWPGVLRIYWHQWHGRYELFSQQLIQGGITDWHAPRTSTTADRILTNHGPHAKSNSHIRYIGVSAWTHPQFEMLHDAIQSLGWDCRWVERSTWDAESVAICNPICIETDTMGIELERRIGWLKSEFPKSRLIVVTSFPRVNEIQHLSQLGVSQVVSKPFELNDLRFAIEKSLGLLQPTAVPFDNEA